MAKYDITGTIVLPDPPVYDTGDKLFTRDDLVDLFAESWGHGHINQQDVGLFLKNNHLEPVDHLPYPLMDTPPDDAQKRKWHIMRYEENRSNTERNREQYRIDGVPAYVPSSQWPSANDSDETRAGKAEKIRGL